MAVVVTSEQATEINAGDSFLPLFAIVPAMFLKRFLLALSCLALIPMFLGGQAARADVTTGSSSAFGIQSGVNLTATPGIFPITVTLSAGPTPTASGIAPPPYNNSNVLASLSASANIGGAFAHLNANFLSVGAQSNVDGTAGSKTTSAFAGSPFFLDIDADVFGVAAPIELVQLGASLVSVSAQVTGDFGALVPSGTTTIFSGSLVVFGTNLSGTVFPTPTEFPAANTSFTIDDTSLGGTGAFTGSITIVLNEQIVTGNGSTSSSITVNGIHATFNQFGRQTLSGFILLSGDLIVSQAQANQTAQAPGGGGTAQAVPEPSSLAMLGVVGLIGAVRRLRTGRWKPISANLGG